MGLGVMAQSGRPACSAHILRARQRDVDDDRRRIGVLIPETGAKHVERSVS